MIKVLNEMKRGNVPPIIKTIYDKSRVNIILSVIPRIRNKNFLIRIRNKSRMPTLATFVQQSIGSPSQRNLAKKLNKMHLHQK